MHVIYACPFSCVCVCACMHACIQRHALHVMPLQRQALHVHECHLCPQRHALYMSMHVIYACPFSARRYMSMRVIYARSAPCATCPCMSYVFIARCTTNVFTARCTANSFRWQLDTGTPRKDHNYEFARTAFTAGFQKPSSLARGANKLKRGEGLQSHYMLILLLDHCIAQYP